MESDELIFRCKERLGGIANHQLPPKETLEAIVRLGDEKGLACIEAEELKRKVGLLEIALKQREDETEILKETVRKISEYAERKATLVRDFAKCLDAMQKRVYEGKERLVAGRILESNIKTIELNPPF